MDLTPECKAEIDAMSYEQLLSKVRFAPIGSPWFQGESGDYFLKHMNELRSQPGGDLKHTATSKNIGWNRQEVNMKQAATKKRKQKSAPDSHKHIYRYNLSGKLIGMQDIDGWPDDEILQLIHAIQKRRDGSWASTKEIIRKTKRV